ncbi:MAG: hypothetical protein WBG46_09750 [Nonlabens sp.]
MKKFLQQIIALSIPLIVLIIVTYLFYSKNDGDLLRLGHLPNLYPEYSRKFIKEKPEILYKTVDQDLSEVDFEVVTIGDSFAQQNNTSGGFKNYIARSTDVLHIYRNLYKNQINGLHALINSDFFQKHKTKTVVLEIVQRDAINLTKKVDRDSLIKLAKIKAQISDRKNRINEKRGNSNDINILSDVPNFTYNSCKFIFTDCNELSEKVSRFKLKNSPFSIDSGDLLVYSKDLNNLDIKPEDINLLNQELSVLSSKLKKLNVELLVFFAPDKYSFYYSSLEESEQLEKSNFFEQFDSIDNKNYKYFNALQYLQKFNSLKDIYRYDDTHWSPTGDSLIALKVMDILKIP